MADKTPIEWADATVNAINGCSLASPGCTNCYAMKQAHRVEIRRGLTQPGKGGMVWTGEVRFVEDQLLKPLAWKRPRRIFWNAHGDPFHDAVPDEWIDRVFAVCALTPQHTHMILTKRSARMRDYLTTGRSQSVWRETRNLGLPELQRAKRLDSHVRRRVLLPLPNVWLGVSVEDQTRADDRIPDLLATPAAKRFISAEPLLGPVDLTAFGMPFGSPMLDWVIVGGESGPGARPMHPDWARSLRDQCAAAGVPFHFKQWGQFWPTEAVANDSGGVDFVPPIPIDASIMRLRKWGGGGTRAARPDESVGEFFEPGHFAVPLGKKAAGRLLDGIEHNGVPA